MNSQHYSNKKSNFRSQSNWGSRYSNGCWVPTRQINFNFDAFTHPYINTYKLIESLPVRHYAAGSAAGDSCAGCIVRSESGTFVARALHTSVRMRCQHHMGRAGGWCNSIHPCAVRRRWFIVGDMGHPEHMVWSIDNDAVRVVDGCRRMMKCQVNGYESENEWIRLK